MKTVTNSNDHQTFFVEISRAYFNLTKDKLAKNVRAENEPKKVRNEFLLHFDSQLSSEKSLSSFIVPFMIKTLKYPLRCYPIMFHDNGNNLLLYPAYSFRLFSNLLKTPFY